MSRLKVTIKSQVKVTGYLKLPKLRPITLLLNTADTHSKSLQRGGSKFTKKGPGTYQRSEGTRRVRSRLLISSGRRLETPKESRVKKGQTLSRDRLR